MKVLIATLALAFATPPPPATPTLTLTGPFPSIVAGQTATLTVSLSGSAGQNMSGVQWTMTPLAGVTIGTVSAGAAVTAISSDQIYSNAANGRVAIFAPAAAPVALSDGVLATVQVTFASPGVISLPLTGLFGVNALGFNVPGMGTGTAYSITVTSPCAVTGDASVSQADVTAVIQALLGLSACSFPGFPACTIVEAQDVALAAQPGGTCAIH